MDSEKLLDEDELAKMEMDDARFTYPQNLALDRRHLLSDIRRLREAIALLPHADACKSINEIQRHYKREEYCRCYPEPIGKIYLAVVGGKGK